MLALRPNTHACMFSLTAQRVSSNTIKSMLLDAAANQIFTRKSSTVLQRSRTSLTDAHISCDM